jgi:hypothetical protein
MIIPDEKFDRWKSRKNRARNVSENELFIQKWLILFRYKSGKQKWLKRENEWYI